MASDLGFLLMDLDRLGAGATATAILGRYRDAGVDLPDDLLRFYRTHRALVRAKVACLKHVAAAGEDRVRLAVKSADYLNLATAAALTVRPVLIVMTGLSGTGKSTVAAALARALGAAVFASDAVRKELAGVHGPAPAGWQEGIYDRDWTEATYARLLALAESGLANGEAVVLDATFRDQAGRERAASLARAAGVPVVLVETGGDKATIGRRIAARQA